MVPTNSQRGVSEAEAVWVVEAIADAPLSAATTRTRRWLPMRQRLRP
jgi:hypothetical protein